MVFWELFFFKKVQRSYGEEKERHTNPNWTGFILWELETPEILGLMGSYWASGLYGREHNKKFILSVPVQKKNKWTILVCVPRWDFQNRYSFSQVIFFNCFIISLTCTVCFNQIHSLLCLSQFFHYATHHFSLLTSFTFLLIHWVLLVLPVCAWGYRTTEERMVSLSRAT